MYRTQLHWRHPYIHTSTFLLPMPKKHNLFPVYHKKGAGGLAIDSVFILNPESTSPQTNFHTAPASYPSRLHIRFPTLHISCVTYIQLKLCHNYMFPFKLQLPANCLTHKLNRDRSGISVLGRFQLKLLPYTAISGWLGDYWFVSIEHTTGKPVSLFSLGCLSQLGSNNERDQSLTNTTVFGQPIPLVCVTV